MRERLVRAGVIEKITAVINRPLDVLAHRMAHYVVKTILSSVAENLRQQRLSRLQRESAKNITRNNIPL